MTKQYIELGKRILDQGQWVKNERTGNDCLTLIHANLRYDVSNLEYPIPTTRKAPFKLAVAELLGYLRGYSNAADFRKLNCKTWDANSNLNEAWLNNQNRKGEDDMGMVYGAAARNWPKVDEDGSVSSIDTILDVLTKITEHKDDRGLIISFWNPGVFHRGCLRPCMHTHQFSILNNTLYCDSFQRSTDVALGLTANMQQCYLLVAVMAQISKLKAGIAYHTSVNNHIYRNQLELFKEQMKRTPQGPPVLVINPNIKTIEDLMTWVTPDDFVLEDYTPQAAIKYPFSV